MGVTTRHGASRSNRRRVLCDEDEGESKALVKLSSGKDTDMSDSEMSDLSLQVDEDSDDELHEITGTCEHDEKDEPFPSCVAFDRDFANVIEDLLTIPQAAVRIIDDSECIGSRAQAMRANADALSAIPRAKREKVALLGNTGAGEQADIEAVLQEQG